MKDPRYTLLIFDWEGTLMNGPAPFEGVEPVLVGLQKAGYTLTVATGKSRSSLEADLKRFDLGNLFALYRCGDEGFSKPHPGMVQEILEVLDVDPSDALMIGDTPLDMQMAQAAQLDSLAVSYGLSSKESLLSLNPTGCIDNIIDLPLWLKNH